MNREKKWTPGEWEYVYDLYRYIVKHVSGFITQRYNGIGRGEELKANAQLISAAPDLVDALEEAREVIVDTLEAIGQCDHSVNLCRCGEEAVLYRLDAALAKAYGETA